MFRLDLQTSSLLHFAVLESLGKSERYRWDSSCLILGLFRSRNRQPEEGERNIQLIVSQEPKRVR